MNGVLRGNTYGPAYRSRPGWRRNDYRVKVDSAIGFRSVNGVERGAYWSSYSVMCYRGVYRNGTYSRGFTGGGILGFRLALSPA